MQKHTLSRLEDFLRQVSEDASPLRQASKKLLGAMRTAFAMRLIAGVASFGALCYWPSIIAIFS
jgi:hypothetical protein